MKDNFFKIALVLLLAVVQASFFSVLPRPFSVISLPLIVISSYALNLRPNMALAAALLYGTVMDLLLPGFFGVHAVSSVLAVAATSILLFRVLTHHTIGAVLGVNAAVFVLYHLLVHLLLSVARVFAMGQFVHPVAAHAGFTVLVALPLQLMMVMAVRFFLSRVGAYVNRYILVR